MSTMNRDLLKLPWGYVGPRRVQDEGEEHWEMRITELPDFFVAGATRDEVLDELRPALRAFLESYVGRGEVPPLPADLDRWQIEVGTILADLPESVVVQNPRATPGVTGGGSPMRILEPA